MVQDENHEEHSINIKYGLKNEEVLPNSTFMNNATISLSKSTYENTNDIMVSDTR